MAVVAVVVVSFAGTAAVGQGRNGALWCRIVRLAVIYTFRSSTTRRRFRLTTSPSAPCVVGTYGMPVYWYIPYKVCDSLRA